jgi:cytosine/adenosine deaminase-related metal-dependent hydrolase
MSEMQAPLIIRDASVLAGADGPFLQDADILIENGRIVSVGAPVPPGTIARSRIIDGRGRLAAPGLVNAHMHSQSATMAGFADAVSHPAFMWLTQAHTSRRTPDEIRLAVLLSAMQMLLTGTTAAIDHFPGQRFTAADMDAVLSAWAETGLRVTLAMRFFDGPFTDILPEAAGFPPELAEKAAGIDLLKPQPLGELRELMPDIVRRWHGHRGRIGVCPGPSNPDRCSDAALVFCAELAQMHDLAIHTHLLETRAQVAIAQARHGSSTVTHLEDLGILSERWSCAHCNWLDDRDIALFARRGAIAVHNPESNARIGAGRMPTPAMLAAGVTIALGTDGAGANDNMAMHEAMRAAAFLHRADEPDRRLWVSAREALRMATLGGARAMRRDGQIGRIAPGMQADIVLYRLDAPFWLPLNDPVAQMVFAETGAGVETVLVDGRILVEAGRVTAFDTGGLAREIGEMARHLRQRNADLFAIAHAIASTMPMA